MAGWSIGVTAAIPIPVATCGVAMAASGLLLQLGPAVSAYGSALPHRGSVLSLFGTVPTLTRHVGWLHNSPYWFPSYAGECVFYVLAVRVCLSPALLPEACMLVSTLPAQTRAIDGWPVVYGHHG